MARRKNDPLSRKQGGKEYRPVCWVSPEGQTERDYFSMTVFKESKKSVRFPSRVHPARTSPSAVLERLRRTGLPEGFRKGDEQWAVVDVDDREESEFRELLAWADGGPGRHLAVSNPKFELFLVMHFESGNGCTTAARVDKALKRHLPKYDKRIPPGQFSMEDLETAVRHASAKRRGRDEELPPCGVTDVHKLVVSLFPQMGDGVA